MVGGRKGKRKDDVPEEMTTCETWNENDKESVYMRHKAGANQKFGRCHGRQKREKRG